MLQNKYWKKTVRCFTLILATILLSSSTATLLMTTFYSKAQRYGLVCFRSHSHPVAELENSNAGTSSTKMLPHQEQKAKILTPEITT